jgi:hypothetical protein
MFVAINPGTGSHEEHSEQNAIEVAEYIVKDLELEEGSWRRNPDADDKRGYYGFIFKKEREIDVDIPGIDPCVVTAGIPWESPRLYVDGSSWLYGYARGFILDGVNRYVDE